MVSFVYALLLMSYTETLNDLINGSEVLVKFSLCKTKRYM